MRSRAAAFADVNVTVDHVQQQQHTAATAVIGHDVRMVHRDQAVEAAAVDDGNATTAAVDTLFHRSLPSPLATAGHQPPPPSPNRTDQAVDSDRVHHQPQSLGTVMVLMVVTVVVLGTVGLLTCVLHHYNQQYNPAVPCLPSATSGPQHHRLSTPQPPLPPPSLTKKKKPRPSPSPPTTTTTSTNSTTIVAPSNGSSSSFCGTTTCSRTAMLTMRSNNGLTREHDRQVRLHSVRTDLELDLPPRIHLPDGEEYPYGSMAKLHLRNSEQEQEIYQKCIRGPPNRTIWPSAADCGKLSQPLRSSSASGFTSLSTSSTEVDSVTRCNSVFSRCSPRTGFPPVDNIQSLSSLTMVPCLSHVDKQTLSQ
ncbi:uncharacterized protein LOC112687645 isoform X2 [Sipha flava]|uniref:Uncharacterized protein LOC112687645 isoform X2 n=1 Tax=Sipha flava TaxID=143950 RepID=A0A8B8G0Z1_9HEMI|nr:uncharacterized protein LOC112687645 isoform X2 [Sipha flava]